MKKVVTSILTAALIAAALFSFTACSKEEEDLSTKIEEKVQAYQTDIEDSAATLTSEQAVRDYLTHWANAKSVSCTTDRHNNVIMRVKAGEGYKDADPTVIVCAYDPSRITDCIDPMAAALYLVKNNESTGKLTVIFTSETGHDFSGVRKLSSKYFTDNTNVFCLSRGSSNMWSVKTGFRSSYQFTGDLSYTAPTKDKAYRISIEGLPGGVPDTKIASYPNPIKEIGDLLAYFKTNSLIFELGKVSGGTSGNIYPDRASATVVIDEDDDEKFIGRMDTAIENFNEDHLESYPDVTYTYEEVDMPDQVVTQDGLNDLISVLYPLVNGVHFRDEEENIISIGSIGSIRCTDNSYEIAAVSNSLTAQSLSDIDNDYRTICILSDVNYKKTSTQEGWHSDPETEFAQNVMQAFNDYCGKDMEFKDGVPASSATYISKKNPKCSIISVAVNEDRLERYTGTILTFLMNQNQEDNQK